MNTIACMSGISNSYSVYINRMTGISHLYNGRSTSYTGDNLMVGSQENSA